jgi:hypothetical protein
MEGMMGNGKHYAPPIGVPPAVQFLAVGQLAVDPAYQRSVENPKSRKLIATIADRWDWRLCVPLLVAQRPAGLFIIDGQHRWEGAKLRGDIPHLPASVASFDSPADEAAIFVAANRARKAMTVLDDFHAAVAAGDEQSTIIANLVRRAGLSMAESTSAGSWKPGELGFTVGLRQALTRHGDEVVGEALWSLAQAFRGQQLLHGGALFAAIVLLLTRTLERPAVDRVAEMLRRRTASAWGEHDCLVGVRGGLARARALMNQMIEDMPRARAGRPLIDLNQVASEMEKRAAGWAART